MNQEQAITVARIASNSVLLYKLSVNPPPRTQKQEENESNLRNNEYNGFMSPKTRSKVRQYIDTWINAVETERRQKKAGKYFRNGRLTFVTLTLPCEQLHTDAFIKRYMFNRFIITVQRKYGVRNYFWRAESQKNGAIHFHILIDKYIHHAQVRADWNTILDDYGYIGIFKSRHGHDNPNSTDIRGLHKVDNAAAYIIKYCCKDTGYRAIKGRIWGCSDQVRQLRAYETDLSSDVNTYIHQIANDPEVRTYETEEYTMFFLNNNRKLKQYQPELYDQWQKYYLNQYQDLYMNKFEIKEKEKEKRVIKEVKKVKQENKVEQIELFTIQKTRYRTL